MIGPTAVRAVLLDIEGTITPISFVYDVLFPYAGQNVEAYLRRHFHENEVRTEILSLREQWNADGKSDLGVPAWSQASEHDQIQSVVQYVKWLMARDSKFGALKSLQGRIWEEGYANGKLVSDIFDDVPKALARWRAQGKVVGIYSSGSILAQKLLFRYSSHGDLTPSIDGFFDTSVGVKSDPNSYRAIANSLQSPPSAVLFISDALKELDAAASAGMRTMLSVRPGNPSMDVRGRKMIRSFDEVSF